MSLAAMSGHTDMLKLLLQAGSHPVNASSHKTPFIATPVFRTAYRRQFSTLKLLIEHSADPSIAGSQCDLPLFAVACADNFELVQNLLEHDAVIYMINDE